MNIKDDPSNSNDTINKISFSENTVKAIFLASITGISAVASFTYAFGSTKKKDPIIIDPSAADIYESGTRLALRALKWGTFYAFSGCGILFFGIWKLSKAENVTEFGHKMSSIFPKVPKNKPQGRTEFESVTDLLQYLNDEYSSDKTNTK